MIAKQDTDQANKMSGDHGADDSLYPIAVLIDELRNEDVQVRKLDNPHESFHEDSTNEITNYPVITSMNERVVYT